MSNIFDALIFDMDGILVDVSNSYRKTIQKTASIFLKREVDMGEVNTIKNIVGMNNDWDATYALVNNKKLSYEKIKSVFQDVYLGVGSTAGLINNESLLISKEALISLKNKYKKLAIATGRPKQEALYTLNRFGLAPLFNSLVGKEDAQKEKPFPDPILKAMIEIDSIRPVYIGDSSSDVVAAEAARIPSFYVGDLSMGTRRFKSMLEVVDYLL